MTDNPDRLEPPADPNDEDALREYGRQLAMDSLIRDALGETGSASETETGDKVIPLPRAARRKHVPAVAAIAACLAGLIGLSIWKFGGPTPPTVAALDPAWSLVAATGAEYEILAANRVRLTRGELRFSSSRPAALEVVTPQAKATAGGTEFLIGHHPAPTPNNNQPKPDQEMNRREMTRLLVLSGMVTMATDQGSVAAEANEAAVAEQDLPPRKIALQANSRFAFDLYAQLAKEHGGKNLFFSPHSLSNALLMAAEGARNKTAAEMGEVLGFPKALRRTGPEGQQIPWEMSVIHTGHSELNRFFNRDRMTPEQKKLRTRAAELEKRQKELHAQILKADKAGDREAVLRAAREEGPVVHELNEVRKQIDTLEIRVANAVWGEKSYPFAKPWLKTIRSAYDTGAAQGANFRGNAEDERLRINRWAEQNTNGRITNLLPPGSVVSNTKLVLTNAVYFKADWNSPFRKSATRDEEFTLASGEKITVPLMNKRGARKIRYAAFNADGSFFTTPLKVPSQGERPATYPGEDGFSMVEIPYRGEEVSMIVLAPNDPAGLPALEAKLSDAGMTNWISNLKSRKVHLHLPKFSSTNSYQLNGSLQAMGMASAFGPEADFTGMSISQDPADRLRIGMVAHKAFIDVNEEGTEAAAATAVAMPDAAAFLPEMLPFTPSFRADRPFLYVIRDTKSGAILFLGRVQDPRA